MNRIREVIISLATLALMYTCKNDLQNTKKTEDNLAPDTETAEDISIYFSEKGVKSALLTAPYMIKFMDSVHKTQFSKGVNLQMYDPEGNLSSTLTARHGEMNHITNQMIAKDSVTVIGVNGHQLRCNDLTWSQNERKLTTVGSVIVQTPTEIIYGDTLIADENIKFYKIIKVRGIIQVKK